MGKEIKIKLKNNSESKKVENKAIQLELFSVQPCSLEEVMGLFTVISLHCLETENEQLKSKVKSLELLNNVKEFHINDILKENMNLTKDSKNKQLEIKRLSTENKELTFANGRLSTASIKLDEENKNLKNELEKIAKENKALNAKLKSIKNFIG